MLITISFLLLFAVLICVGLRFAGKGFYQDNLNRDSTISIRGLLACAVVLHHISQNEILRGNKILPMFVNIGFLFVGLFFFFSGYGLIKSLEKKSNYLDSFFKKRICVVLIPFLIMNVIYFVISLFVAKDMNIVRRLLTLPGFVLANDQAWYVVVAIIMYAVFYFAFKNCRAKKTALLVVLAVTLVQAALFIVGGHMFWWIKIDGQYWWLSESGWESSKWWWQLGTWWFQGEWWVNSTLMFFLGLVVALNESKFAEWMKKLYWLKLVLFLAVAYGAHWLCVRYLGSREIGYWSEFSLGKSGMNYKLICYLIQTVEVTCSTLFVYALTMKFQTSNPVTKYLGNHSLEIYLMQNIALCGFLFMLSENAQSADIAAYSVSVFVCAIVLGILFKLICTPFVKLLKK